MEIVKGNDIKVVWAITKTVDNVNIPEDLSTATNIRFKVWCSGTLISVPDYSVSGNEITFTIKGSVQRTGEYSFEVSYSKGYDARVVYKDAFLVVDLACQANYVKPDDIQVTTLQFYSSISSLYLWQLLDVKKSTTDNSVDKTFDKFYLGYDAKLKQWYGMKIPEETFKLEDMWKALDAENEIIPKSHLDLTGLATQEWVKQQIDNIPTGGGDVDINVVTQLVKDIIGKWFKEDENSDLYVVNKIVDGAEVGRNFYTYGGITAMGKSDGGGGGTGGASSLGQLTNVGDWADTTPTEDRLFIQKAGATHWSSMRLTDIKVDLSNYYTKSETNSAISKAVVDAVTPVQNLLNNHINNADIHVTLAEKTLWNKIAGYFAEDSNQDIFVTNKSDGTPRGFYSNSFVSALGLNTGGGGGGMDEALLWSILGDGDNPDKQIAISHLTKALSPYSTTSQMNTAISEAVKDYIPLSQKGRAGGVVPLDNDGLISSMYLPSYVDDVLEYSTFSALPATGESGKIYVTLDTNLTYRWSGTSYVEISKSLALGETADTAYAGNKGKENRDSINRLKNATFWGATYQANGNVYGTFNGTEIYLTNKIETPKIKIGDIFLEYDAERNAIKGVKYNSDGAEEMANFYMTGGITALGISSSGGISFTLQDLADTNISNPQDKQALVYDAASQKWINGQAIGGGDISLNGTVYKPVNGVITLPNLATPGDITTALNGYATQAWVTDKNYATQSWVNGKGYVTATALATMGFATQAWVNSQGFLKSNSLDNYVTLNTIQNITAAKTFQAGIVSTAFRKSGGTSSQFLKADGSVDSNVYLTQASTDSRYVLKTGDTMTGNLYVPFISTAVNPEDQGDYFYSSDDNFIRRSTWTAALSHLSNKQLTLDLSNLDSNTWYPCIIGAPSYGGTPLRITIFNGLRGNKPTWASHQSGFSLLLDYYVIGSGWGTIPIAAKLNWYAGSYGGETAFGGREQNTMGSTEIIYLRGGGIYYYRTTNNQKIQVQPDGYSWANGPYTYNAPVKNSQDNSPMEKTFNYVYWAPDNLRFTRNIFGRPFNGTSDVTGQAVTTGLIAGSLRIEADGETGEINRTGGYNVHLQYRGTGNVTLCNNGYNTLVGGKIIVDRNRYSFDAIPSISLAIGDTDTGFNWAQDGYVNIVSNGVNSGYWSSTEARFHNAYFRIPSGNDYSQLGIMVNGNGTANTIKPGIGFHQPGVFAGSIRMNDGSTFGLYAQGGSSLANLSLNGWYTNFGYINGDGIHLTSGWLRTVGATGWYNETYDGGWWMTDSTWLRAYGNKQIYTGSVSSDAIHTAGGMNASGRIYAGSYMQAMGGLNIAGILNSTGANGFNIYATFHGNGQHGGIEIGASDNVFGIGVHSNDHMYWWWTYSGSIGSSSNKSYIMDYGGGTWQFTGNIGATGGITAMTSSDENLKNRLDYEVDYASKLLLLGKVFDFTYNDKALSRKDKYADRNVHTGLSWQKVRNILPTVCGMDKDGYGYINYISPDLISLIAGATQLNTLGIQSILNRTKSLEERVKILERRNEQLELKIKLIQR
ncbi:hypothetical protein [uncultured phage cr112_1]|uniref:Bacterial shufflon protein N-terminal domain-containing protein n=1 Tax=uncultured phage cr112_1 TaxID=2772072 RepID=A0A7M1S0D2_9CAUD|nr:peptidase [uncultured phage cr112_1]QOR59259.1 hypothetical protein [uncultured phage cr112_1]